jgi:hypothetical protein
MLRFSRRPLLSVVSFRAAAAASSGHSTAIVEARRLTSSKHQSSLSAQDVDTSKLNHMYWDDDVLLPYLLNMMDEFGGEFSGDSLNFVPQNDSQLLQNEFIK